MILAIRTDTDMAELALLTPGGKVLGSQRWQAGRQLSTQLLGELTALLAAQSTTWDELTGLVVFGGPGSFTGLRIGVTVANTLAYAQGIPIVAAGGEDWLTAGVAELAAGRGHRQVLPNYGAEPNITKPKR